MDLDKTWVTIAQHLSYGGVTEALPSIEDLYNHMKGGGCMPELAAKCGLDQTGLLVFLTAMLGYFDDPDTGPMRVRYPINFQPFNEEINNGASDTH